MNDNFESAVICSKTGVNAVVDKSTGLFIADLSESFYWCKEQFGYNESDFDRAPTRSKDDYLIDINRRRALNGLKPISSLDD